MNIVPIIGRISTIVGILLVSLPILAKNNTEEKSDTMPNSKELQEVVVKGVRDNGKSRIGHISISGLEINKRPALLGEHDVIKALQSGSGVVSGTEGFAGLYVRGGETDQNLYLVDGLPLLNVYHFGGLFSTFSTYSVESVDFYKGAFPALYGGRASSVVDISLKNPDYYTTTGIASLGLISGQFYLSTPLKRGTAALSLSLRRTWFDIFSFPALAILNATKKQDGEKSIFNYNFTDLMVKVSATDRRKNDISLLMFMGKDNFKLGEERFDPEENDFITRRDLNRMSWGNWGLAMNYRFTSSFGNLKIQPYFSKAFAVDEQENLRYEGEGSDMNVKTEIKPSVLQMGVREIFSFPLSHWLESDIGLEQSWYEYSVGNLTVRYETEIENTLRSPFANQCKNSIFSGFGEFHWRGGDIAQGSVGLRVNRYVSKEACHWDLEPRLNLRFVLPYSSNLSFGYTRLTQYAQQVSSNYIYLPSDAWLPTANYHKPLQCDVFSLGYFKNFKEKFTIKAEAWLKKMHNLGEYKPNTSSVTTTVSWQDKISYGKGWAYGLDIELEGHYKMIDWNIGYGLMWNWRKFSGINSGRRYPAKFDNRHKVDISVGWNINDRLELTGQWEYMTGNRTTLALYNISTPDIFFPDSPFLNPMDPGGNRNDGIDYYENCNNVRLPSFHRLNLNLTLKGRINDRLSYHWDFGLYNAYCRMNPFSVVKNYVDSAYGENKGDYRKFKTLSLIPLLPSVSYTLNF